MREKHSGATKQEWRGNMRSLSYWEGPGLLPGHKPSDFQPDPHPHVPRSGSTDIQSGCLAHTCLLLPLLWLTWGEGLTEPYGEVPGTRRAAVAKSRATGLGDEALTVANESITRF